MKNKEVEFKYSAENISLDTFTKFCKSRDPQNFIIASGYDHFYCSKDNPDAFGRHRIGPDANQLTFKRKTTDANNFVRKELNMNLAKGMTEEEISALFEEFGYSYSNSIFKTVFVYQYDWYILAYYICYDSNMQELGRFMEIEMDEKYAWEGEDAAFNQLVVMEKLCKPLGITAQSRIKRSLYELFGQSKK